MAISTARKKISIKKSIKEFNVSDLIFNKPLEQVVENLQRLRQEPTLLGFDSVIICGTTGWGAADYYLQGSMLENDDQFNERMKKVDIIEENKRKQLEKKKAKENEKQIKLQKEKDKKEALLDALNKKIALSTLSAEEKRILKELL